ncbi:hypothetical protein HAX54_049441 [Datura stramonium]|uniref:Uncharacterized protein n=1 Tax=Datura stramonium TaxID=4076 RepID=A0ABS8WPD0_DATST|nr:hypothetical protein [Datura stramonium]
MTGNLPQSFQSLASIDKNVLAEQPIYRNYWRTRENLPLGNLVGWDLHPASTRHLQTTNGNHKSRGNGSSLGSDGGGKSGIGGGGIAGIVICILVVGAIVAFFIIKKRSRRLSTDVEKLDNQPFAPLTSQEVQDASLIKPPPQPTDCYLIASMLKTLLARRSIGRVYCAQFDDSKFLLSRKLIHLHSRILKIS